MKPSLLLSLIALLLLSGCALRKPIHAMYCEQKTPDGKHCAVWAAHKQYECPRDVYGDCVPGTGPR